MHCLSFIVVDVEEDVATEVEEDDVEEDVVVEEVAIEVGEVVVVVDF